MSAFQTALKHMGDAFRPERKAREHILCQAHHVKTIVEAGRNSFFDACKAFEVTASEAEEALLWLVDDNARLNDIYDTDIHHLYPSDFVLVGWMNEQEHAKLVPLFA